jgi:lipoprotein-anchoring transpeptidase ErfK/SrfK
VLKTLLIWLTMTTAALAQLPAAAPGDQDSEGATTPVSRVLTAQIMLDRVGFSPGEIDGLPGKNLRRAVEAFQRSRDLPVTGRMDDATARRVTQEAGEQPAVMTYIVTDADVAGPFQPDIPEDLVEQSKLPSLDYRNALEALAERFHASPALLKSLNPNQTFDRAGEQIVVPNVASPDLATAPTETSPARVQIVVSKRTSALTVQDEKGRVLFFAPVTTGSNHDPLPIGKWKVNGVQRSPVFQYNPDLFWDADPTHSKARIPAGPNNPVGVAWIDISKDRYGIHGTPEPSTVGHMQSHGCVRMTNWDVQRVLQWAKPGTLVIFQ